MKKSKRAAKVIQADFHIYSFFSAAARKWKMNKHNSPNWVAGNILQMIPMKFWLPKSLPTNQPNK